ncbi:glycosyltransferase [Salisediminibacterium halotolerans]|uniref:Glycosyltransferase involved in cell wall bisynthesis n=1 Tax=Salisediminibacterium halotolerans TaxID=517425 RepID=A0A1H9WPQ0_9BACI|nr:glycosyltransferase [Salisediminibacterium haloalkalitolerans]SES35657.1 Glycosyltransferase involved in cell wall bisynthesis [Salisediminibacterium haloalkalitolerans]
MTDTKVVHITTVHHPLDPRITLKECRSLAETGYDVTLIAKEAENVPETIHGVKYDPFKQTGKRFVSMFVSPFKVYKKAKEYQADVYHIHDPELLPVGYFLKKQGNVVIYDVHEDYETGIVTRDYFNQPVRKLLSKIFKAVETVTSKKMNVILAEKYYQEKYPQGVCVLNYPILENQPYTEVERDFNNASALLYTGNVTEDRGALQHALFPAIDNSISVTLIGRCPKDLYLAMKNVAGAAAERLQVIGVNEYIAKDDIDEMYARDGWLAGVAMFPDSPHYERKELTKFFEYMLAGLPVVCTNMPEWKAFIDRHDCGLTAEPDNPDDLRQVLETLRNNPERAKEMGINGRNAVKKELHWGIQEQLLLDSYARFIKKEKGEPS